MKHLRILAIAAAAMLAGSTLASAQEAFTTSDVNMRAGPGSRYPVVTTIPSDREVIIHGCLSNWDWCDVSWRRNRGWVFSDYLEALYRNRRIGFDEYRTYIDVPFVSFSFGYWDRYYRDRPWFDDWDRWGDHGDRPRWRDRDRDRDRYGDRDRNRDRTGDRDDDNDRVGDRNRMNDDGNDDGDRSTPRNRRVDRDDDERPGMRCGTINADPSCPDASRGRRMQMEEQQE
jgi:uncharacterized protein YraI